jgi:hypothetical protein
MAKTMIIAWVKRTRRVVILGPQKRREPRIGE